MATYTINWTNHTDANSMGVEHSASADTLSSLMHELATQGYEGSPLRAVDDHGFTAGWVSATDWRAV